MDWPDFARQGPARWIAGGGALAGVLGIVLNQTVFSPAYEVLYRGGIYAARCTDVDERSVCAFAYDLTVGNTGRREQDSVRIVLPLIPQNVGVDTRVADIVGSAAPTPQPQILHEPDSGNTIYTIIGLMPNTLVNFSLRCLTCTPAQLHAMQQAQVRIEARGAVSEADPRLSALRRGAMNLLRVVGLFY